MFRMKLLSPAIQLVSSMGSSIHSLGTRWLCLYPRLCRALCDYVQHHVLMEIPHHHFQEYDFASRVPLAHFRGSRNHQHITTVQTVSLPLRLRGIARFFWFFCFVFFSCEGDRPISSLFLTAVLGCPPPLLENFLLPSKR